MDASNWLSLLKWSLAQGSDGTVASEERINKEDIKWLEEVMKSITKDEPKRLNEIITHITQILDNTNSIDDETLTDELEELKDIVEQIDMAQIFAKFGGLLCLLRIIKDSNNFNNNLRGLAASVIATVSQNHLVVQDMIFNNKIIPSMNNNNIKDSGTTAVIECCSYLNDLVNAYLQSSSSQLNNKLLYAMSSIIRGHAALEEIFMRDFYESVLSHGLEPIKAMLVADSSISTGDHTRLVTRLLFLTSALLTSDYSSHLRIIKLVNAISSSNAIYLLKADILDLRETAISLITAMLKTKAGWVELLNNNNTLITLVSEREQWVKSNINNSKNDSIDKENLIKELEKLRILLLIMSRSAPTEQYPPNSNTANDVIPTRTCQTTSDNSTRIVSDSDKKDRIEAYNNNAALAIINN